MSSNYHLTDTDSSTYESGYEIFLKRTDFREKILGKFESSLTSEVTTKELEILDIGCGNGEMTSKYVEAIRNGSHIKTLSLLEPSESALNLAITKTSKLVQEVIPLNVTLEKFIAAKNDKNYDLIIASYVFYHLTSSSINSLISKLKPLGKIVIMMGGPDHPLRKDPNLKAISKHGDSSSLKQILNSRNDISINEIKIETNLDLSNLINNSSITPDGNKFFSFIYNEELDHFSNQQMNALLDTVSNIEKNDKSIAHPTHEIIWVKKL